MFVPNPIENELRQQFERLALALMVACEASTPQSERLYFFDRADEIAAQTVATAKRLRAETDGKQKP